MALHQAGRLDDAAVGYQRVLQAAPGHFDATRLSGVVALQRGDLATAEKLISQALATKPKDAGARNNLGTTLLRAGRLEDALAQFERAAKAQPQHVDAQTNLGTVLRRLGRVAEAVAPLKRAWAGNPKSGEIAALLGASLIETGGGRGAVAVFEASVKARPRDARAWLHLSIASEMAGNSKRALEAADQSLALEPAAAAHGARGRALAGQGQLVTAREAFDAGVRAAPRDAVAQHNFGVFLREQGEIDAALAQLREALKLDPALDVAHEALFGALVDGGHNDEALRHGQAFGQSHPDSSTALAMQASAQFALGHMEDAVSLYASAVAAPGPEATTFLG